MKCIAVPSDGGVVVVTPTPACLSLLVERAEAPRMGLADMLKQRQLLSSDLMARGHSAEAATQISEQWVSAVAFGGLHEDDALALIALKDGPVSSEAVVMNVADLPSSRRYRAAWKLDKGALDVDIDRAKSIFRDQLRAARTPLLASLDVDYQRADEEADTKEKARIASRKRSLRDVTALPAIDAAKTIADLDAAWPHDLLPSASVRGESR